VLINKSIRWPGPSSPSRAPGALRSWSRRWSRSRWPCGTRAGALRARIALAEGRLDDAEALAEPALRSADATGLLGDDALVMLVLATVALRRGDLRTAAEYAERLSARGHCYGLAYLAAGCRMVAARVMEARHGPRAARDFLADVLADLPEHRSVLLADPANAPWLVRVALAAGDRGQAERIDSVVSEMSRSNPTFTVIRELGLRHRHWATEKRPAAGWESLTDTEQATASLVAQGLTNQQAAHQLFISTHTVAFHLRQVFRKLDIRSRVELTRIARARPA
jgi:DNA-binding CsgD family transcriptional regulator